MPEQAYLTRRQLRAYLGGVSDEAIDAYVAAGSLPAPRRLGRAPNGKLIWRRSEVDHHIDQLPPVDLAG